MHKLKIPFLFGLLFPISLLGFSQANDFNEQTFYYSISAKETDSVDFPDYFSKQKVIDSLSIKYSNSHKRALAIESLLINDCSVEISIDSVSRIVKLQNGNKVILAPNDSIEEAGFTYEKEFKDLNLLLFRVQWIEGNNYCLLNSKNGKKTNTIGRVFINPSRTLLISINDDIQACYSDNGFQLFKIEEDGKLNEVWNFSPFWAPENIKWIDDSTLIVKGYYYSEIENLKYKEIYKKIRINER